MRTNIKTLQDISGLQDIRTYSGTVKRRGLPSLPTSYIIELQMRRNERDRLRRELRRIKRKRIRFQKRLRYVEKQISVLSEKIYKMAVEFRGEVPEKKEESSTPKGNTVVGY